MASNSCLLYLPQPSARLHSSVHLSISAAGTSADSAAPPPVRQKKALFPLKHDGKLINLKGLFDGKIINS